MPLHDTEADVLAAVDAGATGYLLKDAPPAQLFEAIRAIARGTMVFAPTVAARMVHRTTVGAPLLTAREIEILQLLAKGLPNRALARRLFVSEATVKSHLGHIYTKLGVESRTAAVTAAAEQRIIRFEKLPPKG